MLKVGPALNLTERVATVSPIFAEGAQSSGEDFGGAGKIATRDRHNGGVRELDGRVAVDEGRVVPVGDRSVVDADDLLASQDEVRDSGNVKRQHDCPAQTHTRQQSNDTGITELDMRPFLTRNPI